MAETRKTPNLFPWLLAELGIGALALFVTGLFAPALQPIARSASALAIIAGLFSLIAVHIGCGKPGPNGLLAAIAAGFFCRMVLIALGLLATGARGDLALGYTFTFFAIFALTAATEIAYVIVRSRKSSPAPKPTPDALAASTTR